MNDLPPLDLPNPYQCPCCKKRGRWRSGGPEFESMMRCGECNEVWTPFDIEIENQRILRERLKQTNGTFGDGI